MQDRNFPGENPDARVFYARNYEYNTRGWSLKEERMVLALVLMPTFRSSTGDADSVCSAQSAAFKRHLLTQRIAPGKLFTPS
ncbi:unnamed protein product [Allacma fusca]|uniref:Uncharacterized protein n=1 Tax=Allacma fusca TaxID=39272 RepID=A0A8J2LXY5_9HEXA|nr:unnamed protein product [Allacma fusca]